MNSLPKEWIVLAGNPNTGKTAIFNLLTGLHQKVSNYPGITVEKKFGIIDLLDEKSIHILDLPGSYSLTSETFDEHVVSDEIFSWIRGENKPNLILSVVDVENLSRNLYFTSQLLDIGIPVIVVLNMMDQIQKSTLPVSVEQLKERLGAIDVVPVSAIENQGIDRLKDSIITNLNSPMKPNDKDIPFEITGILRSAIRPLFQFFTEEMKYSSRFAWAQSVRIISRKEVIKFYESGNSDNFSLNKEKLIEFKKIHSDVQKNLNRNTQDLSTLEPQLRYRWIDGILRKKENLVDLSRKSKSEKADKILTHKLWGPFIFIGILYLIFQSVFSWAVLPMNWVNNTVAKFGNWVYTAMPEHIIRDLVVEGVIGGVGAVLVFMPQIIFLVLFMAIMEDTGYMARIAFMMDRLMSKVGLHGRSVLPLMTGYA
ncbi:MAG TPA: ferrous iron transporter B, partial [Candidatus Marinimicrobia bacterium]|nr:ferrous iron transporter B [Candidatus Neomarinimicrobiota bacterium]